MLKYNCRILSLDERRKVMELLLVHITDIHINNEEDYQKLDVRSEYIANAINKHIIVANDTIVVLCITGDIAYSGSEEQYLWASIIITNIIENIKKRHNGVHIQVVTVPGNHDCDFERRDNKVRESLLKDSTLDMLNVDIVEACTTAQNNYFDFVTHIHRFIL